MKDYIEAEVFEKELTRRARGNCMLCFCFDDCNKRGLSRKGTHKNCWQPIQFEAADVVPRSEVELDEIAYKSLKQLYDNDTKELSDNIERLIAELEQAKQEVAREIIQMIQDQARDAKYYAYADIRNAELAELTIKILKKYIGE